VSEKLVIADGKASSTLGMVNQNLGKKSLGNVLKNYMKSGNLINR
jgi:hypothetical protein